MTETLNPVTDDNHEFKEWWSKEGIFLDSDTSDVPWFDKRKGLCAYAFYYGKKLGQSQALKAASRSEIPGNEVQYKRFLTYDDKSNAWCDADGNYWSRIEPKHKTQPAGEISVAPEEAGYVAAQQKMREIFPTRNSGFISEATWHVLEAYLGRNPKREIFPLSDQELVQFVRFLAVLKPEAAERFKQERPAVWAKVKPLIEG